MHAADAADFDDLLGWAVALLRGNPQLRAQLQNRFRCVCVCVGVCRGCRLCCGVRRCLACCALRAACRSESLAGWRRRRHLLLPRLAPAACVSSPRPAMCPPPAPPAPRHILVDEVQDTHRPQYERVRRLAPPPPPPPPPPPGAALASGQPGGAPSGAPGGGRSVFVVGDPDQAIYGWRGSDASNMVAAFGRHFPGSQTFALRDNYRSSPHILAAAGAVIARGGGGGAARAEMRPLAAPGPLVDVSERVGGETAGCLLLLLLPAEEAAGPGLSQARVPSDPPLSCLTPLGCLLLTATPPPPSPPLPCSSFLRSWSWRTATGRRRRWGRAWRRCWRGGTSGRRSGS